MINYSLPLLKLPHLYLIFVEFGRGKSFRNRSLFIDICVQVLQNFSRSFFKEYFYEAALELSSDPVPNIRLRWVMNYTTGHYAIFVLNHWCKDIKIGWYFKGCLELVSSLTLSHLPLFIWWTSIISVLSSSINKILTSLIGHMTKFIIKKWCKQSL